MAKKKKGGSKKTARAARKTAGYLTVSFKRVHNALNALEDRLLKIKSRKPAADIQALLDAIDAFRGVTACQKTMTRSF